METLLNNRLRDWIATLDGSKKVDFCGFGLNALFPMSRIVLCFSFLHAIARCWNPITHVFHFGSQEMCPTIEEFQALMESRHNEEIIPQSRFSHAQALGWMCGFSVLEARFLARDGELDILDLVHRFSTIGNRDDLL
ncbi:hypothetical protein ACSBR2_008188 [Camellia fascicularis]